MCRPTASYGCLPYIHIVEWVYAPSIMPHLTLDRKGLCGPSESGQAWRIATDHAISRNGS